MHRFESLSPLRNGSFRRLWLAGGFSLLGTQVSRIGLILYLFRQQDSIPALAALVAAETLPGVLVAPLAGTLVDRFSKRTVMVLSDLVNTALMLVIVARPTVAVIFVVAALHSVAAAFFQPAKAAAVPLIVRRRELPRANGLEQSTSNLLLIAAPILGAELLLRFGLVATLLADAVSYLVSALLLVGVSVRPPTGEAAEPDSSLASAHAGWRYLGRHSVVLQLALLFFVSLLCAGLWLPLAPFFIRDTLGASERILGWQIGVTGAGAILGAVLAPVWMRRYGKGTTLFGALFAEGCTMTLYSQIGSPALSTSLMFLWGVTVSAIVVPFYSIMQSVVEERFLGRVFSVIKQSESLALLAAMGAAVLLPSLLSIQAIFLLAGLLYCGLTAASSLTHGGRLLRATR